MVYQIAFKPRALKDMKALSESDKLRILAKIEDLQGGLVGDIKKLAALTHE